MNVCEEVITSSWTSTVDWLMLAQPSWRRASGVWLEAFIVKGKGPEDKCWCLPRRSKLFFFFERVFFPLKQTKFTRMCLICAVWRISIIRLKYKDNNRKQCGRRRWTWQEVASYLRLQPILWQILSVRATNRRPSCVKIKPPPPSASTQTSRSEVSNHHLGSLSWWLE